MSDNPYSSHANSGMGKPPGMNRQQIVDKVKLPATFMLIGGLVNTLITAGIFFFYGYMFMFMTDAVLAEMDPAQLEDMRNQGVDPQVIFDMYAYGGMIGGVVALIAGFLIVFGAFRMMQLKSWGLGMTAAIMSLIPCLQSCCLLGIPIGIYAIVTLSDSDVKRAFAANK